MISLARHQKNQSTNLQGQAEGWQTQHENRRRMTGCKKNSESLLFLPAWFEGTIMPGPKIRREILFIADALKMGLGTVQRMQERYLYERASITLRKTRPVLLRSVAHHQQLMIYSPSLHRTRGRSPRPLHWWKWCTIQQEYAYNPDACE